MRVFRSKWFWLILGGAILFIWVLFPVFYRAREKARIPPHFSAPGVLSEPTGGLGHEKQQFPSGEALAATTVSAIPRKVIMNANLTLEVKDFPAASSQIAAIARRHGGYVAHSQIYLPTEGKQSGTVTIKVPQEKYGEALEQIKKLGKVVDLEESAEDVTEKFIDMDARLRNLKVEEERVLAILQRAGRLRDVLLVEERLSSVREKIETLEGQFRYLKFQIAMATIKVNLHERASVMHIPKSRWVWWNHVKGGWHAVVVTLQALATVLTYIALFGVIWAPACVVIILLRRRKINRRG